MGRHLACGIATKITISKGNTMFSDKNYSIVDNKDKILEKLKKHLDLDVYDCYIDKKNNILQLEIKEDYVNQHLHNLILELDKLTTSTLSQIENNLLGQETINPNDFNQDNYPLIIHKYTETDTYENDYQKKHLLNNYALISSTESRLEEYDYYPSPWMLDNDRELILNIKVNNSYIILWLDISKISCEDESDILKILNTLSRTYFKNPLGKNLIFHVFG